MTDEAPRRFYKAASVAPAEGGFAVLLDGRRLRTPAKVQFVMPTRALAEACAAEWNGQGESILAETMPITRLCNVALDYAPGARAELARHISKFGETDLVCHRADRPPALVARQAAAWDPLLAWAEAIGAPLNAAPGILALAQPASSLEALARRAAALDDFRLIGLAHGAGLAGSALIAFALAEGRMSGQAAFVAAALDDLYQLETWGEDDEARQRLNNQAAEFAALEQFFAALKPV